MSLEVIGTGLPRTGTASLKNALEYLLNGKCYHMREIPGHPFDLGEDWNRALADRRTHWEQVFHGYIAAVDWPTSMFWRELSETYPDALVLLSMRDSAETWWRSMNETILPIARMMTAPEWQEGHGLLELLERFTGTKQWDDAETLMASYKRHNKEVLNTTPKHRLLEWQVSEGWYPICRALDLPVPDFPFPWTNKRSEWGN